GQLVKEFALRVKCQPEIRRSRLNVPTIDWLGIVGRNRERLQGRNRLVVQTKGRSGRHVQVLVRRIHRRREHAVEGGDRRPWHLTQSTGGSIDLEHRQDRGSP